MTTAAVELFRAGERGRSDPIPTAGMRREELFATPKSWAGRVRTEAGNVTGWHHHGDYDTCIYVISGALRIEFGAGGAQSFEASPGDVIHVPEHAVHREVTPELQDALLLVIRSGSGPPVVNVDGPAP